jgi:hypothetical protein
MNFQKYGLKVAYQKEDRVYIHDTDENFQIVKELYAQELIKNYYMNHPYIVPRFIVVITWENE